MAKKELELMHYSSGGFTVYMSEQFSTMLYFELLVIISVVLMVIYFSCCWSMKCTNLTSARSRFSQLQSLMFEQMIESANNDVKHFGEFWLLMYYVIYRSMESYSPYQKSTSAFLHLRTLQAWHSRFGS